MQLTVKQLQLLVEEALNSMSAQVKRAHDNVIELHDRADRTIRNHEKLEARVSDAQDEFCARIAKTEFDVREIKRTQEELLEAFTNLAYSVAAGFERLEQRLNERMDRLEQRMDRLENRVVDLELTVKELAVEIKQCRKDANN